MHSSVLRTLFNLKLVGLVLCLVTINYNGSGKDNSNIWFKVINYTALHCNKHHLFST